HLHLEYSDNLQHLLQTQPLLLAMHQALFNAGYVTDPDDLKSRAIMQQDYVIGLSPRTDQAYAHAKVSLLSGRSVEVRQAISALVLEVMQQSIAPHANLRRQISVEIVETTNVTYNKVNYGTQACSCFPSQQLKHCTKNIAQFTEWKHAIYKT